MGCEGLCYERMGEKWGLEVVLREWVERVYYREVK